MFIPSKQELFANFFPAKLRMIKHFLILLSAILVFSLVVGEAEAQSNTIRTSHSVTAHTSDSANIPLIGQLRVDLDYTLDFEIVRPKQIEAGTSQEIWIFPIDGVLTTTVYLDGKKVHSMKNDINLGQHEEMTIPYTFVLDVFAKPSLIMGSTIEGYGQIYPSQQFVINSMSPQKFTVSVNDNIYQSFAIRVWFPMALQIDAGFSLNLFLDRIDFGLPFGAEMRPPISETIPIYKNYQTTTSLQIRDGSSPGYIQVKPSVSYDNGKYLSPSYLSLYVDSVYYTNVKPDVWSSDIKTGSGTHYIEAVYSKSTSPNNRVILYEDSLTGKSFNVKSPPPAPKQTTQVEKSFVAIAEKSKLECGRGTHQENSYCVADNNGEDFFSSIFQQIEGFFKSIFGN